MFSCERVASDLSPLDTSPRRRRVVRWILPEGARVLLAGLVTLAALGLALSSRARCPGSDSALRAPDLVLEPNTAPLRALEVLPHVGSGLANRLVEARIERPFTSLQDLRDRVRGMGDITLARIAPHLRFSAASRSGS